MRTSKVGEGAISEFLSRLDKPWAFPKFWTFGVDAARNSAVPRRVSRAERIHSAKALPAIPKSYSTLSMNATCRDHFAVASIQSG